MDFKRERVEIKGDLVRDPSTMDLAVQTDRAQVYMDQAIEIMDMAPADDIDFPHWFSRQRAAMHAETRAAMLNRIRDARRVIGLLENIDKESIEVRATKDDTLNIVFRLKDGTPVSSVNVPD